MDEVGHDVRALLSTFNLYSTHVRIVLDALDSACELEKSAILHGARDRFRRHMESITSGNGLHLTQDTRADEGASFVVPNLGITIVPLVYGDHHSWNIAWLDGARSDVPIHFHEEGAEIHLGYSPVTGYTVLNDGKAKVNEGYAMPIPPKSRHGFVNLSSGMHHVPFIFGSLRLGGWGVFADITPQPIEVDSLANEPVSSSSMNGTAFLEREIQSAASHESPNRYPIIRTERTDRDGIGGLELSIVRVTPGGYHYHLAQFCAVSVVRGKGVLHMLHQSIDIVHHDHFGIPAGITAEIIETGNEPLVLLDAVIRRADR
jgi:mannose-6-phosphate isomerase-like protein (cupin superfamily)